MKERQRRHASASDIHMQNRLSTGGADWQEVPRGHPGPQAQGHRGAAGQV